MPDPGSTTLAPQAGPGEVDLTTTVAAELVAGVNTADVVGLARRAAALEAAHGDVLAVRQRDLLSTLAAAEPGPLPDFAAHDRWVMRRGDGSLVGSLRLAPGGFVEPDPHPNESMWGIERGALVLRSPDGTVTTHFHLAARSCGRPLLVGIFQDGRTCHVLSPATCAFSRMRTTPRETIPHLVATGELGRLAEPGLPASPTAILAAPRTGSHLLINLLNSSDRVFFDAELLNPSKISVFGGDIPLDGVPAALRTVDPVGFVRTMLTRSYHEDGRDLTGIGIRGFKIFPAQSQPVWNWALDTPDVTVIHLWRENLLAEYSSLHAATRSGRWVGGPTNPADLRLEFDPQRFTRFVQQKQTFLDEIRARLRTRRGRSLEIEYSQVDENHVREMLGALLSTSHTGPLSKLGLTKQVPGSIVDRFADPTSVEGCLRVLGHPEWAVSDSPGGAA